VAGEVTIPSRHFTKVNELSISFQGTAMTSISEGDQVESLHKAQFWGTCVKECHRLSSNMENFFE
jgi:hypothetical protein